MAKRELPVGALNLGNLGSLKKAATGNDYRMQYLEIDRIDPDPDQPRKTFNTDTLAALSDSIRARGVKTPISVRPHPTTEGRFMLNHGHRRLRAAAMAGLPSIPAFIDPDYQDEDQVHENLHRDNLTPREMAEYIDKKLKQGLTRSAVADLLKVSNGFVTQHHVLLDLPPPIATAFNTGRVSDVTLVYNLTTLYKKNPDLVATWLDFELQDITRGTVALLKNQIEEEAGQARTGKGSAVSAPEQRETIAPVAEEIASEAVTPPVVEPAHRGESHEKSSGTANSNRIRNPVIRVLAGNRRGTLKPSERSSDSVFGIVCFDEGGSEEVRLDTITIYEIVEG